MGTKPGTKVMYSKWAVLRCLRKRGSKKLAGNYTYNEKAHRQGRRLVPWNCRKATPRAMPEAFARFGIRSFKKLPLSRKCHKATPRKALFSLGSFQNVPALAGVPRASASHFIRAAHCTCIGWSVPC